jgi:hypothetical protein
VLRDRLFPTPVLGVAVLAICFVLPAVLLLRFIAHNPTLSPIDEAAHLDYVIRASHGEIPRTGEPMTQQTARIIACTGVRLEGLVVPKCRPGRYDVRDFPAKGYSYEAQQPPVYYGVTAVLRAPVASIFGVDDYLKATRITGYFWWSLGLFALWAATRVLRIDPWASVVVLLFVACAPDVLAYSSMVSNDAPSLLFGSLSLLSVAAALRRPSVAAACGLVALGLVAGFTKTSEVFPAVALALYAFWMLLRERGTARAALRPWLLTGGALLGGAALATLAWLAIRSSIGLVAPRTLPISVENPLRGGFRIGPFVEDTVSFFGLATDSPWTRWAVDSTQKPFIQILRTLLLVAAFLGLFVRPRAWFHRLGLSTLVAIVVCGLGLAIAFYVTLGQDPSAQSRYGLALVPLLAAALAAAVGAVHDRRVTVLLGAVAVASLATTVAVLA